MSHSHLQNRLRKLLDKDGNPCLLELAFGGVKLIDSVQGDGSSVLALERYLEEDADIHFHLACLYTPVFTPDFDPSPVRRNHRVYTSLDVS